MWAADDLAAVEPPRPSPDAAGAGDEAGDILPAAGETVAHYPEWDRLIARLRPDWCSVIERPDPAPSAAPPRPLDAAMRRLSRRMRAALGALSRQAGALRRSRDGEVFDVDALVHWRIATRLGRAADTRIYRARQPRAARAAVCLLVDQSASTAAPHGASARSVLQAAAQSAAATALALQANGIDCAVAGFSSNGRHAVRLNSIKRLGPASTALLAARLQALRSGGSTRLGAALRHAAACLGRVRSGPRWVLVLSDGQPHDIDVHDPRYLVEDARHAVRDAARRSVRMVCLTLAADAQGAADARCIFGHGATLALKDIDSLPRAVQRLLS
jgi:nitric oxide reductase activation protein